jgi:hypothetical protein
LHDTQKSGNKVEEAQGGWALTKMLEVYNRMNGEMNNTFAACPTKVKMPEDYAKNIQAVVKEGLLDPVNQVEDCQLLFACVCGAMLGFQGNQVQFG